MSPLWGKRLKSFLEKDNHQVEIFVDPASALNRLNEKNFDIVISDIRMGEDRWYPDHGKCDPESAALQGNHDYRLCHAGIGPGIADQRCFLTLSQSPLELKEIRKTIQKAEEALGRQLHKKQQQPVEN